MVQLPRRPLGLRQLGLRLVDVGLGGADPQLPGPVNHELQDGAQSLDLPFHRPVSALRLFQVLLGDERLARLPELKVPLVGRFELLQLGLGLFEFFADLDLLLGERPLEFLAFLLGRLEGRVRPADIGVVVRRLQLGQHVPLLYPFALDNVEPHDFAGDFRTDEDLVRRDDVALALISQLAARGRRGLGRAAGQRRGRILFVRRRLGVWRVVPRCQNVSQRGHAGNKPKPQEPRYPVDPRAAVSRLCRQPQRPDPLAQERGSLVVGGRGTGIVDRMQALVAHRAHVRPLPVSECGKLQTILEGPLSLWERV